MGGGVGGLLLGLFFYVHVETSAQQSILHPHNKSGRRFPLSQGIDGGGGGVGEGGGQRSTLRVLLQLFLLQARLMNHTKNYPIKTFLELFCNVIIGPDARKAPCDLAVSDQSERPIIQDINPQVTEQASQQTPQQPRRHRPVPVS